jgi:hypothetical protein
MIPSYYIAKEEKRSGPFGQNFPERGTKQPQKNRPGAFQTEKIG